MRDLPQRIATAMLCASVGAITVGAIPVDAQVSVATATSPRLRIADGEIVGTMESGNLRLFRGIPFAAPPVRGLRWQPPQPAHPWSGVRLADRFAAQCMQTRPFADMVFRNDSMSEDCLYLNVWAPSPTIAMNKRLPVLVYFYGGGFIAGDGSEPRYDGASMARRGLVVVTVSYRLGIFGFFSHPALTQESPQHASGNYAFMDQAASLQWVRTNIAAFRGDPQRVTIAGESAGSFSVSALMASPLSKALIAGAIGESGALLSTTTLPMPARTEAESSGVRFATAIGAESLVALRGLSAMELLAASSRAGAPRFGPNIDGWFFPEAPEATYAAGRQSRVPLLAGWNSEEQNGRAALGGDPTPENMSTLLSTTFGASAAEAATVYPSRAADDAAHSATDFASDRFIAFGTWKWLELHGRTSGKPVYRYLYARPRPPLTSLGEAILGKSTPPRGAAHSAEIEYAMGNLSTNRYFAWTPDDDRVSATMQTYFANFVKTGNPNGAAVPSWPVGAPDADGRVMHMRLDVDSRAEPEARARYLFLDRFYSPPAK